MTTSISGTSGITFPNGSNQDVGAVGVGQTWQDVKASRAAGTTYTNNTGKPIVVAVASNGTGSVTATVGGVSGIPIGFAQTNSTNGQGNVIVPAGMTYSISAPSIYAWFELR